VGRSGDAVALTTGAILRQAGIGESLAIGRIRSDKADLVGSSIRNARLWPKLRRSRITTAGWSRFTRAGMAGYAYLCQEAARRHRQLMADTARFETLA
jgi:hypothetical protein